MPRLEGLRFTFECRSRKAFWEMHVDEQCSIKVHLILLLEWISAPMTFIEPKIGVEMPAPQAQHIDL